MATALVPRPYLRCLQPTTHALVVVVGRCLAELPGSVPRSALLRLSLRVQGRSPAAPARPDRTRTDGELRARSAEDKERETRRTDNEGQRLTGNGRGPVRAWGVGWASPSRAGALPGAAADAGRMSPLPAGGWLFAVTRVSGTAHRRSVRVARPTVPTILSP